MQVDTFRKKKTGIISSQYLSLTYSFYSTLVFCSTASFIWITWTSSTLNEAGTGHISPLCLLSQTVYCTLQGAEAVAMAARTDDHLGDDPVWFITMVTSPLSHLEASFHCHSFKT